MFWMGLIGTALAGKWDGATSDVSVSKVIDATAEEIHAKLTDWQTWQDILPIDCAQEWEIHGDRKGLGARATATYTFGPMHRELEGVITKDEPGRVLETELAGRKGWFTQVRYAAAEGGTMVTMGSPVTRPKWPITGVFFGKVRPAWSLCYEQALDKLAGTFGS